MFIDKNRSTVRSPYETSLSFRSKQSLNQSNNTSIRHSFKQNQYSRPFDK
jgi:hypothetical protein